MIVRARGKKKQQIIRTMTADETTCIKNDEKYRRRTPKSVRILTYVGRGRVYQISDLDYTRITVVVCRTKHLRYRRCVINKQDEIRV